MLPPPAEKLQNFFGVFLQFLIGVDTQSLVGDAPLTYEKTVSVTDGAGEIQNVVNYRTYNRKKQAESSAEVTDKPEDCKG